ncbi:hypothetical protein KVR01_013166 [Diaporthe batatas]|uniref:uncharacterized protein n=1 Tax=Diaporthe batatas TaxID=748121 RepID=UPI001D042281|nr:uncharacterized protein KVR01_013166 [Diaporthe batatas]KAG8156944.1 hypothetical protein KVR01_013166 [Diaporthe batatas]
MNIADEEIKEEIRKWVTNDDSRVGRITSRTPLAINKQVLGAVWDAVQTMEADARLMIVHVCNTTLEAELLDHQLKDKDFRGGRIGEQSVVSKTGHALGAVVLLSYLRLRQLLEANTKALRPLFPSRVIVICEQEPGSNMDAVIARGQFALLARENLVRQSGFNVKMLGLSYRPHGGWDWLDHPHRVMSTLPPSRSVALSLDLTDTYEPSNGQTQVKEYARSDTAIVRTASLAGGYLRDNKHVVVYGSPHDMQTFIEIVENDQETDVPVHSTLVKGTGRDIELDIDTAKLLIKDSGDLPGHLVAVESGSFSVALPFVRVGMVVSITGKDPHKMYENDLHLTSVFFDVESDLTRASQRWTGQRREGPNSGRPSRVVEILDREASTSDAHIQEGTPDPLREFFVMAATYPGRPLSLLPIFKAVDDTRDLARRLRVMGLLVYQGQGFELTEKGHRAMALIDRKPSLTIESATALAGIDGSRMGAKVVRSILRLCFIKDMHSSFVTDTPMGVRSDDEFVSFLRRAPLELEQGGPGRHYVDMGMIWLMWASFECISASLDSQNAGPTEHVAPGQNWPVALQMAGVREAMEKLASWERLMGLAPMTPAEQEEWNQPFTPSELNMVEEEIARANYSTAIVIPFPVDRTHEDPYHLTAVWLRTGEPAKIIGEFDQYLYAYRFAMTGHIRLPDGEEHMLIGGFPLGVVRQFVVSVSVHSLMWYDYDVTKSLIGDLDAPDVDPLVREMARR